MTTITASVGLNTKPAKQHLAELKALMRSELGSVKFLLDASAAKAQLADVFGKTPHDVLINTTKLKSDLQGALDQVFKAQHKIGIDRGHLTDEINKAIAAAGGVKLGAGGVSAGPTMGGSVQDLALHMQKLLVPAVDELVKAAALVGTTSRRVGMGGGAAGDLAASQRYSSVGPDGSKISVSRKLGEPEAVLGQVMATNQQKDAEAQLLADRKLMHRVASLELKEALKAERDALAAAIREQRELARAARLAEAERFADRKLMHRVANLELKEALKAERDALAAAIKDQRAQAQAARLAEAERLADQKLMHRIANLELKEALKAERDALAAAVREQRALARAAKDAEAEKLADRRLMHRIANLELRESIKAEKDAMTAALRAGRAADQDAIRNVSFMNPGAKSELAQLESQLRKLREAAAFVSIGRDDLAIKRLGTTARDQIGNIAALQERVEALRLSNRATAATADSAAAALRRQMQNVYASAKFGAADTFTGRGTQVAGAKALIDQFGEQKTSAFLNNDKLVAETANLDRYRKVVKDSADETDRHTKATNGHANATRLAAEAARAHARDMHTAHSAARGLAAGFNSIWLTYGQVAPLIAGFALAGSLRVAIEDFAQVQYQLTFVAALAGDAKEGIKGLSEELHRASLALGVAPTEAAKGLRGLTQAGLSTKEAVQALPDMFKLATVGELALADASVAATGIMNAFALSVGEIGRVNDVLAKAGAMSATSVASITESMKYASVIADQYGISIEEVATVLTALGKRNITGSAAGTSTKNMLNEMFSPSSKEARNIMDNVLKVDAYAASGERKKVFEVVEEMRTALGRFDPKSQGLILRAVFGEKGDKAFGSLLAMTSDQIQETLKTLETSAGFTSSVFRQLQSTVSGQFSLLKSTVLNTLSEIGEQGEGPLLDLMRTIRQGFASDEVKSALAGLVQTVGTLGTVAAYTLPPVLAVWGVLKTSALVTTGVLGLAGAVSTMGRVVNIALAGKTGLLATVANINPWVRLASIIGVVAAGYFTLKENQRSLIEKAADEVKSIDDITAALERENKERAKKLAYEALGKGEAQAAREDALAKTKGSADAMQARLVEGLTNPKKPFAYGEQGQLTRALSELRVKQDRLEAANAEAARLEKAGRDAAEARRKAEEERVGNALKTGTKKYTPGTDTGLQGSLENAEVRSMLKGMGDELAKYNQQMRFRKELEDATYDERRFGAALTAMMSEYRALDATNGLLKFQEEQVARLNRELATKKNLSEADQVNIRTEIDHRKASNDQLRAQAKHEAEIARLRSARRTRDTEEDDTLELQKLARGDSKQIADIRRSSDLKISSSGDASALKATLEVEERYATVRAKKEADILQARAGVKILEDQLAAASIDQIESAQQKLTAAKAHLDVQVATLNAIQMQEWASRSVADTVSRAEDDRMKSAGYGWDRFWAEYRSTATSSADMVYGVMKTASTGFQDMWANALMTGKLNFRSFAASVLAEVARMMASKAMAQLLSLGLSFLGDVFGSVGSTGNAGAGNYKAWGEAGFPGAVGSANGNIVTPFGAATLQRFEAGGVTRSPLISLFGEGRKPEAYVPLQDGRTIPVTVNSGGGSGGDTNVNVSVYLDQNGGSRVESDASGEKASQLGDRLQAAVVAVIVKEKRPGGLLYANG